MQQRKLIFTYSPTEESNKTTKKLEGNMSLVTSLQLIILPQQPRSGSCSSKAKLMCSLKNPTQQLSSSSSSSPISLVPNYVISFALAFSLTSSSPALAIPSLSSSQPLTTPFTQSKFLQTGLLNGPCPSTNPGCVSTNPTSSSFSFPLTIPDTDTQDPILKLKEAIVSTQKNPKFLVIEDTPYGRYLEAEVEGGGFSRDVMEFLVKKDVVAYRCMATKVTFVYPFTTAFGDSKGQEERMKKLIDQLGWYAPTFESME